MMTPEDIAALLATQDIQEPVVEVSETPAVDPNRMMTPEDIAALLAAQDVPEPVVETPEPQAADPNRMMTPEDIAALLAAQDVQEPVVEVPEPPVVDPNRMMTPEDIAALLATQDVPEPVVEVPETPVTDPNRMMTPEDIAQLLATQDVQEPVVEAPEAVISELETPTEEADNAPIEAVVETADSDSDYLMTPDDIAQLLAAQNIQEPAGGAPDADEFELASLPDDSEATGTNSLVFPENDVQPEGVDSPDELKDDEKERNVGIIQKVILFIKKALSKKSKPVTQAPTAEAEADSAVVSMLPAGDADTSEKEKKPSLLNRIFAKLKRPPKKEKKPKNESKVESPNTEAAVKPSKKSGLRTAAVVLVVLLLMGISFAGGFFSRDLIAVFKPDPAQLQAQADAKAKAARDEKRAEELAKIKPKDYTSSMYIDSIILKGSAEKMTSIKLQKIDNIDNLVVFKKLRRIKLVGMKGDEDLSVIQKLKGVEEITIENSVLKNQFSHGDFSLVTYLGIFDSTVANQGQFASFKGLTELDADNCKFLSSTGNLELTDYMPAIETLNLNGCGTYGELAGVDKMKKLKYLYLTNNTLVKNMTYVGNPLVESATLDISFADNLEQLRPLANLKKAQNLTIQSKENHFASSQLDEIKNWLSMVIPTTSVSISTY